MKGRKTISREHIICERCQEEQGSRRKMRFCRQCGGGGGGGGGLFGGLRLYVLLFGNLSVCLFVCLLFFSAHLLLTEIPFSFNNMHSFKEHVDFSLN